LLIIKERNGMKIKNIKDIVKNRYSKVAEQKQSCCGSSCCCGGTDTASLAQAVGYEASDLKMIPEDASLGLGCGSPVGAADLKAGEIVLDLGSGAGMDVFLSAAKVGASGKVFGVDMTQAMVDKARGIAEKEGYKNVEFRLGDIESLPLDDSSVDAVISNCVINLSTDKAKVFREAHRVLKQGGRIVVSDIVTEGELPESVRKDPELWAGCIAGALKREEYIELIKAAGFYGLEVKANSGYHVVDSEKRELGGVHSITVTARK